MGPVMPSRLLTASRTQRRGRRQGRQARITLRRTTGHTYPIPAALCADPSLTSHHKLVWSVLDSLQGQNVLQSEIAKLCGCSVAGVRKATLALVAHGRLMVLSRCAARTNVYLTIACDILEVARADSMWERVKEAVPPDDEYEDLLRYEPYFRLRFEDRHGRKPTRQEVRDWRAKLPAQKGG